MSNYTEFVKNYLNKNILNEASVSDMIKTLNDLNSSGKEDVIREKLAEYMANNYENFKAIFGTAEVNVKNDKKDFQKVQWYFGKSSFNPLAYEKQEESAFTKAYMTFITQDLNLKNPKSKFVLKKYYVIPKDGATEDSNSAKLKEKVEDFCKSIGLAVDFSKDIEQIQKEFKNSKLMQNIGKSLQKVSNRSAKAEKLSFQTKKSDWNKFAKIITYKCVEMLSEFSSKDTKIDAKTMQNYMSKVFNEESDAYFSKIQSIDELMEIDAVLGVFEDLNRRGDEEPEKQNNSYYVNFVNSMLNEENKISDENLTLDAYRNALQNMKDVNGRNVVNDYVNAVKEKYPDKFKQFKNELNAEFDKGRTEIIESEKADSPTNFTDPLTGESEKRVGRLGHHGPMTYINNSPNLKKAVDAIDGQKWNIFNCAAKLLIKFFKVLEEGSKSLQRMKQDIASGVKDMKDAFNNEKIQDFKQEEEEIMDGDEPAEDKQEKLLMLMGAQLAKYENKLYEDLNSIISEPWVIKSEEGEENLWTLKSDLTKALQDKVGLVYNDLLENAVYVSECLEKLDKGEDVKVNDNLKKEEPAEAQQQESFNKKSFMNFINEEDDIMGDTEKMVSDEADAVKKDAEKEQKAAEDSSKSEEKDNKETKEEKPKEPWQRRKFNFPGSEFEINIGKFGQLIEDGDVGKLSDVYRKIADKVDGDAKTAFTGLADFIDLANPEKSLSDGRFLFESEVRISTITGLDFMEGLVSLLEKLKKVYPNIKSMVGHEKIQIDPEQIEDITDEVESQFDAQEIENLGAVGSALTIFVGETETSSSNTNNVNNGNLEKLTSDIVNAVKGTNRENYKNAIDTIKKKREDLVKQWTEYQKKWQNGVIEYKKAIPGIKDNKFSKTQALNFFHLDKISWPKNEHIIPTIWLINNYFSNVVEWNNTYKIGKLEEATNSEMDKGFDNAFKQIEICIPDDIKSEVYNKTYDAFMQGEYTEFKKIVSGLVNIVVENKDKLKEDYLKAINQESGDKFVAYLQDENTDDLLKLESMLGYFVSDDEEANGKLSDELKKKVLEFTTTITKITDKSEPKKVAEYKKKGEDLYKEIQSALKDNKEMTDYLTEFLKRLQEATKETESLFVISIIYALNVFASADELKPLMENFTKITNCFLLEGLGNSKLTKAVRGYVSSSSKGDDKAKMQAVQTIAKELKANPKIKLEDLKGSNLGAAAFEDLKKDLESVNGSPEKEQANEQDSKAMEELKAKLPEWLKKLIACAEAGKKPVTIKQYADEYNPIKEDVANYYNKLKEAKKVPEDQVTNDVLLQVLQIFAIVNGGNKEEAKPEQSSSNVPATQEQPKEGAQPQAEQPKEGGTQESLNWLANEFYKYIRG